MFQISYAARLLVVTNGVPAERSRHGPFVRGREVDVCVRRNPLLDQQGMNEGMQTMAAIGDEKRRCGLVPRSL
jgi:hypothetical protein